MTSIPRKYRDRVDVEDAKPVVAEPPPLSAAETKPAETPKPAEKPVEKNPVEEAALKARLAEMERAQKMAGAQPQQPQRAEPLAIEDEPKPPSTEQIIANSGLPERMKAWLRAHPEYILDQAKNVQLHKMHTVAEYEAGGEWSDGFFQRLDHFHLHGFKQPSLNGNGAAHQSAVQQPRQAYRPTQAAAPPVRQQQYSGPPVSAPPTRETLSMATGRSVNRRVPLTEDERQIARSSGISDAEYEQQKDKMNAMKVAGYLQDGR
jgi:hypothetical protein